MENTILRVGKNRAIKNIYDAINLANEYTDIIIDGGKYFIPETIVISKNNISISSKESESVIFTASKDISNSTWEDYSDKIKRCFIGANLNVDCLFLNNVPMIMARYPSYKENILPLGGVTTATEIKKRSKNWKNPTTGKIRALHDKAWGGNDYFITGIDENSETGLSLKWIGNNNRGNKYMFSAMVAENIFEELTAENEWFYDKATGYLYFYPASLILDSDVLEISVNAEFIKISSNDMENPIKNVTISGIEFQNSSRAFANDGKYECLPLLRGDWAIVKAAAIFIENSENIKIQNSSFLNIGTNAIFMYGYNNSNLIYNNRFVNLGSTAVQIIGLPSCVNDPSFWDHALFPDLQVHKTTVVDPTHIGPIGENYPRDIIIENNYITNIGVYEKQSSGVNLSVSSRIKILHNTIHKSARSNININDGSFGGHEIAYNDVFDAQRETHDHGPFNSWGRDRFWSVPCYNASGEHGETLRNYTNDNKNFYDVTLLDAYQTTTIHNNRFHHDKDAASTWGVDLDDGSSNYEIFSNLCLGMGIKLREGFSRKVYNNILVDGTIHIHVPYTCAGDEIYSNLLLSNNPWGYFDVNADRFIKSQYKVNNNWYYNFGSNVVLPNFNNENYILNIDPIFKDPYSNDYTILNKEAIDKINFKNFDMNNFGRKDEIQSPVYAKISANAELVGVKTIDWHESIISNINESIISATASHGTLGVYFEKIGNVAYDIGFRKRDVVKKINDTIITDIDHFINLYNNIEKNSEFTVNIHRTNDMHTFTFIK